MARDICTRLFPDLAAVFRYTDDAHPFWAAVAEVTEEEARAGRTLLTDLEQAAAWYRSMDKHELLQEWLEHAQTQSELMPALTKLYVAYLYRHHDTRMAAEGSGYDIELDSRDDERVSMTIPLADVKTGDYDIEVTSYYDRNEPTDSEIAVLHVTECAKPVVQEEVVPPKADNVVTGEAAMQPPVTIVPELENFNQFQNSTVYMMLLGGLVVVLTIVLILLLVKFVF